MKKLFLSFLLSLVVLTPASVFARDPVNIYDWYIKDFQSETVVNKDSSLDITEIIIADCGNLPNKHGIFHILPEFYYPEFGKKVKTPVELISITNANGVPYNYETIRNKSDETITWKIGDADTTVTGENTYIIKYYVKNTIRFGNGNFDEFYWNLNGNFWDIETDHFVGKVIFPFEINQENVKEVNLYSGSYGTKDAGLASYSWIDKNTIQVESKRTLMIGEGITLSATFPKGIISPPVLTYWEKYGDMIIGLILLSLPFLTFAFCFTIWFKYGKDPNLGKSITPEFEVPDNLQPMEFGAFLSNNSLRTSHISAGIVNLAVKKIIKIEEVGKKGIFGSEDTKLTRTEKGLDGLEESEKELVDSLFGGSSEILISSLKNKFYTHIPTIKRKVSQKISEMKLFDNRGSTWQIIMFVSAGLGFFGAIFITTILASGVFFLVAIACIIILIFFGAFMTKRSLEGADLLWRIKGFRLYMTTAEKYRQQFNEKENIFEKFLPYAMVFGIVHLWIKKMKEIYGEEYFNQYQPIWYTGSNIANFNIDTFSSQLTDISSSMSSTMSSSPSSSGSGGGGFSGGGGGGSGGGGW